MVQGADFQPVVIMMNAVPSLTRNAEIQTQHKGDIRFGTQDMRRGSETALSH
jgi:hypothetical protein